MWTLAPNGITVSAISSGTPIFLVASKFTGIEAALEQVANDVTVGDTAFDQNAFIPSFPPAINAYKVNKPK